MDLSTTEGRREQGRLIRLAAEMSGLSLEALAERIGCSRALIYQYASGRTLAQADRLQKIASATGKSMAYFYSEYAQGEQTAAALKDERELLSKEREKIQAERELLEREGESLSAETLSQTVGQLEELAKAQEGPPALRDVISTSERIISLARELRDKEKEAEAHLKIGNARIALGEAALARTALEKAAALFAQLGKTARELAARQSLGNALLALGHTDPALEEFKKVRAGSDWWNRWQGEVSMAAVYEQVGDYRAAVAHLDGAAEIVSERGQGREGRVGDLYVQANMINVHLGYGEYRTALSLARECVENAAELGIADQHIEGLLNVGTCLHRMGGWGEGERSLLHALELARFTGDRGREAVAGACLADLWATAGRYSASKDIGKDALTISLRSGIRRAELLVQAALGNVYLLSGAAGESLHHFEEALGLARELRTAKMEAAIYQARASARLQLDDLPGADEDARKALRVTHELGAKDLEACTVLTLARLIMSGQELDAAMQEAGKALDLGRQVGLPEVAWAAHDLLAHYAQRKGNLDEATRHRYHAIEVIEGLRSESMRMRDGEDTVLCDPSRTAVYLEMVKCLQGQGKVKEAGDLADRVSWPPLEKPLKHILEAG